MAKSGFILDDFGLAYFTHIWTIDIVDVPPKFWENKYSCPDQNLLEIPHPSHLLYEYEWMDSSEKIDTDFYSTYRIAINVIWRFIMTWSYICMYVFLLISILIWIDFGISPTLGHMLKTYAA